MNDAKLETDLYHHLSVINIMPVSWEKENNSDTFGVTKPNYPTSC